MKKINKKQRELLVKKFNEKNGGIKNITKDGSIILCNGHSLWLNEQIEMMHKLDGRKDKKLSDGSVVIGFTNKKYPTKIQDIGVYCRNIDDFIKHMKKVRKLVKQCGFKTYELSLWKNIKFTTRYFFSESKKWFDHKNYERKFKY